MPRIVSLNKTDESLALGGSGIPKKGDIKQRTHPVVSADGKYQEDREQCTRGRGTGMRVKGAVLQKWSGKTPLGNPISQQRSEGREGTRKTSTRKNNIPGRGDNLGKGFKCRCACCVLARKPGYLEQSQRGEGKLVKRWIREGTRSHN